MEQITVELNGIKYLIVEILATSKTNEKKLKKKIKKYDGIYQGIKDVRSGGFFGSGYGILKILIPEKRVIEWNDDDSEF